GADTADDAAVYRVSEEHAVIATTDFFMPIVDDPFDFGQIAAANALSDVYAMGGKPIFALTILGMPIDVLPPNVVREILRGGESVCAAAGVPIAGGHSIDSKEPIYGLAAIGIVHPKHLKSNADARGGDVLGLGKPLSGGILSGACTSGRVPPEGHRAVLEVPPRLTAVGPSLAVLDGVHAMPDVTGFGLLGHLLEMCRGAVASARIGMSSVPLIDGVLALAEENFITGASARNWASYGDAVELDAALEGAPRALLCDPQTSGGLLVACAEEAAENVIETFERGGFARAAAIGRVMEGPPRVIVDR